MTSEVTVKQGSDLYLYPCFCNIKLLDNYCSDNQLLHNVLYRYKSFSSIKKLLFYRSCTTRYEIKTCKLYANYDES